MDIILKTTLAEIDAMIDKEMKRADFLTIKALSFLGEKCVIEAKDRTQAESWFDDSGNLRSSIGYVIVHNGRIVQVSSFEVLKEGAEGAQEGKELTYKLAKTYNSGFTLIIVAGMGYAAYVEAMDNKVVLASAELLARKEVPNMMKRLKKQIKSAA